MVVSEAARVVLDMVDLADEEEYTLDHAIQHVIQAIFEMAEENEFVFQSRISQYELTTPDEGAEPEYWNVVPGRVPLTTALGASLSELAYIKHAWVSDGLLQGEFKEMSLIELLDEYGDDPGTPEAYAVDGEYLYWRPYLEQGSDDEYTARFHWSSMPAVVSSGQEPAMLSQIPYGVIHRACALAALWAKDDQRVPIFEALAQKALDRYNARVSMTNDPPRESKEYNG